ncbi:ATP-dependent Clp protease proteolytic subunit [[Clostridium] spiroforme]|nr:ATP-dependent Clp protease proteolytic subunit [Thomasclavelia spiroformis]MBM6879553.1 ATP-dependent Clp protease proteolytic subunit [Thomasclavelia spiroformis]
MTIYNPQIMTNTNGTEHNSDLRSELFEKKRVIFIDNEINSDSATSIITQMMYLNEQSFDDIYLLIDSPGGSVSAGYRIYDYIKYACRCDVVTIANGIAASMGAFLLAAGTKGKRFATHSSEIMIHQPLGGTQGQATEMIIAVNHILKIKKKLTKILAEACDKDFETVADDMERDYWMDADEAKDYGIIDCIGFPEELKEV